MYELYNAHALYLGVNNSQQSAFELFFLFCYYSDAARILEL